jgi:hypothetical protein
MTAVVSGAMLAIGIILRIRELLANRSLSQDQAQLALNIMDRPFARLFGQLDFNQAAPPGYLAVEKLVVEGFGNSEYSLRLFPFLAGTLALVLMLFLARAVVSPPAVPLALGVFAFSAPLIAYTASDKQYAVDVLMTVVVLLVGFRIGDHPREISALILFAGGGAAAVWVSHASVFMLAGVSFALFSWSLAKRQWRSAASVAAASIPWLASFAVFASTTLGAVEGIQRSLGGSPGALAGSGTADSEALGTGIRTSLGAFRYVAGIPHFLEYGNDDAGQLVALIVAALCIFGLASIRASHPERALLLIAPLGFMLIAWALDRYPLLGRTQLFLVPIYVLCLGEGAVRASSKARATGTRAAAVVVTGTVGAVLAAPAVKHVANPAEFNEIKPVLEYIAMEEQASDRVYVYYTAQPQLRYYLECGCAGSRFEAAKKAGLWPLRRGVGGPSPWAPAMRSVPPRLIVGQERDRDPESLEAQLAALRAGTRVWVLLPEVEQSTRASLVRKLDQIGTRRTTFAVGDVGAFKSAVVVYLYEVKRAGRVSAESTRAPPSKARDTRSTNYRDNDRRTSRR